MSVNAHLGCIAVMLLAIPNAWSQTPPAPSLEKAKAMLEEKFIDTPSESRMQTITVNSMRCLKPVNDGKEVPCQISFEKKTVFRSMPSLNSLTKYSGIFSFQYSLYGTYEFKHHNLEIVSCDESGNTCKKVL